MSEYISKDKVEKNSDEQEEKLKQLNTKNLSNIETIYKSIELSCKNWKIQLFMQISHFENTFKFD